MHRRVAILSSITSQARRAVSSSAKGGKPDYVQGSTPKDTAKPIPDERIRPPDHGVPPGAFPSSSLYKQFPDADKESVDRIKEATNRPSSSSSSPAHTGTTQEGVGRAGKLPKDEDGVGWSAAVRHRSSPGEMSAGGEGGLGLMNDETSSGEKPK